jgi:ssDNA-binding Zn-finger/Zn-ribbon topoisomerase 1
VGIEGEWKKPGKRLLGVRSVGAGKQFWTCSAFPKCKHIESIN